MLTKQLSLVIFTYDCFAKLVGGVFDLNLVTHVQMIQRTYDLIKPLNGDMSAYFNSRATLMTKQTLDISQVCSMLQEMGREGVT